MYWHIKWTDDAEKGFWHSCILILVLQSRISPLHPQDFLLQSLMTLWLSFFFLALEHGWTWHKATRSATDLLPLEIGSPLLTMVEFSVATYSSFLFPHLGWIWDVFYTISHNPFKAPVAHSGNLLYYLSPTHNCLILFYTSCQSPEFPELFLPENFFFFKCLTTLFQMRNLSLNCIFAFLKYHFTGTL